MSSNKKTATNNQWVTASAASCANCGCKSKHSGKSMVGNFDSVGCECSKEK